MKKSDNRPVSGKPKAKRKPPRTAWKKGQSGNPKGAPKRGESWAELFKEIGAMTPAEAARKCHAIAGQIMGLGDKITLKEAVVLRVYSQLLFEPTSGLLNTVLERVDGKVPQPVETSGPEGTPLEVVVRYIHGLGAITPGAAQAASGRPE